MFCYLISRDKTARKSDRIFYSVRAIIAANLTFRAREGWSTNDLIERSGRYNFTTSPVPTFRSEFDTPVSRRTLPEKSDPSCKTRRTRLIDIVEEAVQASSSSSSSHTCDAHKCPVGGVRDSRFLQSLWRTPSKIDGNLGPQKWGSASVKRIRNHFYPLFLRSPESERWVIINEPQK